MEKIDDFSDSRNKSWCIHCGSSLASVATNEDHVPSRCLLAKPHPRHLPAVIICRKCNSGFAPDEEYLAALIGAVLAGSVDPDAQVLTKAAGTLRRNVRLRELIGKAETRYRTRDGETRSVWKPDVGRVNNVVLKNARGHAYFEYGEPMLDPPVAIWALPLSGLTDDERDGFEDVGQQGWPEVGSRMMTRVVTGEDLEGGWVSVQPATYRYAVVQDDGLVVRSVIANYLATEVRWD